MDPHGAYDPPAEHRLFGGGAPLARLKAELLRFAAADVHFADIGQQLAADAERLAREEPAAYKTLKAMGYVK